MKKRVLSVLLCLVMVLSCVSPAFAAETIANTKTVVTADKTVALRGETITFTVALEGTISGSVVAVDFINETNPGGFAWNGNVFEFVEGVWANPGPFADVDMSTGSAINGWLTSMTVTGEQLTFTLKVKEDAAFGTYTIDPVIIDGASKPTADKQVATVQISAVMPHEGAKGTEKAYNDTHHWTKCATAGCEEHTFDKAEHTFADCADATCDCGYTRVAPGHTDSGACDEKCNTCNGALTPSANHTFADCADAACDVCGATRTAPGHTNSGSCDEACNTCGAALTPTAQHTYTDCEDTSCNVCGATRTAPGHDPKAVCSTECKNCSTALTPSAQHDYDYECDDTCNVCGSKRDATHKYDGPFWSDDNHHWKKCDYCGIDGTKSAHAGGEAYCKLQAVCATCNAHYGPYNTANHPNFVEEEAPQEKNLKSAATCTAAATYYKVCDACGAKGTETYSYGDVDLENHVGSTDGKWYNDAETHYKNCACGEKLEVAAHEGGKATCTAEAICSVCSKGYGEKDAENHVGSTDGKWFVNADDIHYQNCACGVEINAGAHEGGKATCAAAAVCSVCSNSYGEKDPENHTGETEIRDKKAATCTEEGSEGNTYCKGCDLKLSDGKVIDKIAHNVVEWTVVKEATTEEEGEKNGKCTVCSTELVIKTEKLEPVASGTQVKVESETEDVTVETVGETNVSDDVVFVAEEVSKTINATELEKVEKAIADVIESVKSKVAMIFDLKLILKETSDSGEPVESELKLNGKMKITLPIPTAIVEKFENIKLLHIADDGKAEIVPYELKNGKAVFEATSFSYYTFVGDEKVVTPPTTTTAAPTTTKAPEQTTADTTTKNESAIVPNGDSSMLALWIALAIVSVMTLARILYVRKREENNA